MNAAEPKFAAWVGIDWADQEHAVCLVVADGTRGEHVRLPHTPAALDEWAAGLRQRFGGRPIAVALEQSRGALVYALMKYEFLVLFPINPKQLSKYREALAPSGAKDDPTDAQLLCDFVRLYHDRLRAWQPDDELTRQMRLLGEDRRRLVADRTRLGNRLQQQLKQYFPLALELVEKDVYAVWFLQMLTKWPTLRELQRAAPRSLAKVLPHRKLPAVDGDGGGSTLDVRCKKIRQAQPLVTDRAIIAAGALAVRSIAAQIQVLNQHIAEYDKQLAALLAKHPDAALFDAFPGAGPALAPRLVAAFGTDRKRFASAQDLQRYSGIAPVQRRSGKTTSIHRRQACPKFLRQTFHEFAGHSIRASRWAAAYYKMLRDQGKQHHAAVRSLAFKWLRILYRCWHDHTPYDEQRHLHSLRARKSPLLAYLPAEENS
jgi:transposase